MQVIPARIYSDGVRVFMQKECTLHGIFQGLIWSDYQLYHRSFQFNGKKTKPAELATSVSKGCPYDCGLCPEHKQHTCLAILEITDKCNLNCPICLASSPKMSEDPNIEQIEDALKKLLGYEGRSTSIQLSGGEPTVRQDLADIINIARDLGFKSIEIDTNGIELAKKPKLAKDLADAGLTGIYLQFDGVTADVQASIRGSYIDLLTIKEKAIERAKKAGLEVALAATIVKGVNDNQLWKIIRYAIKNDTKG
ncbi:radical SAM protein, partial [Candidatus Bathyarchaeota archaeon]